MNTRIIKLLILFIILIGTAESGFFRTSGHDILDGDGNPIILRGIGLGGWLVPEGYMLHTPGFGSPSFIRQQFVDLMGEEYTDEFYAAYEANYVAREDIQALAEMGFNSIRVPFHYRLFYDDNTGEFRPEGFELIDRFLDWCREYELYVILDMHCAPGGQSEGPIADGDGILARLWTEPANQDLTIEIWREIARHYVDEELIIGYDLLNEPVLPPGYSSLQLRLMYIRLVQAVRFIDQNHIFFIEGNWYATDFSNLIPPMDDNMVYAFHKYWGETTQGTIQYLINMRNSHNRPLWLGESGENSNPWFYEAVRLVEENNIGWNWWTHKKVATLTSPYSAPIRPGYQAVLDYLSGTGPRPSAEQARVAMLDMAEGLKLENCDYRPGVVKALFDEEFAQRTLPFKNLTIPGIINAVDYDFGYNGLAYYDTEYRNINVDGSRTWNNGWQYRNDGVDIGSSDGTTESEFFVGWTKSGEWLNYTVNIAYSGTYSINLNVATNQDGGILRLLLDNEWLGEPLSIPNTGGWLNWQTLPFGRIELPAGEHQLLLFIQSEEFNIDRISTALVAADGLEPMDDFNFFGQNYPNPFNIRTTIPIVLTRSQQVAVEVYNSAGQLVATINDGQLEAGLHEITWDGANTKGQIVASGVYYYQIRVGNSVAGKKMILIK